MRLSLAFIFRVNCLVAVCQPLIKLLRTYVMVSVTRACVTVSLGVARPVPTCTARAGPLFVCLAAAEPRQRRRLGWAGQQLSVGGRMGWAERRIPSTAAWRRGTALHGGLQSSGAARRALSAWFQRVGTRVSRAAVNAERFFKEFYNIWLVSTTHSSHCDGSSVCFSPNLYVCI